MTETTDHPTNRRFREPWRVIVTRTEEQSSAIIARLTDMGATVLLVPMIRIEPASPDGPGMAALSRFHDFDYVVFTSVNAVTNFFRLFKPDQSLRRRPAIIAIGNKTMEAVQEFGFAPDFVPEKFNSRELIKSMGSLGLKSKTVLIPKGDLSGSEIAEFVRTAGGHPDEVIVYNTVPADRVDAKLEDEVVSGRFDAVLFFSPSQVRNFVRLFGGNVLRNKLIGVIGPTTRKAAEQLGLPVDIEPRNSTAEDLIESLLEHEEN